MALVLRTALCPQPLIGTRRQPENEAPPPPPAAPDVSPRAAVAGDEPRSADELRAAMLAKIREREAPTDQVVAAASVDHIYDSDEIRARFTAAFQRRL